MTAFVLSIAQLAMTLIAAIMSAAAWSARRYYKRQAIRFDWSHRSRCNAPIMCTGAGVLTGRCALYAGHRPSRHLLDPFELRTGGLVEPPF
jgi:hypothetical protein